MFDHLMVGVDFALQPQLHYRFAVDLAVYLGSSLDLFTPFHPKQIKGRLRSTKKSSELLAHFQERMRQLKPAPPLSPVTPNVLDAILRKKSVQQGLPKEELLHYAQNAEIDLLLLGISAFSYPFKEEFGDVPLQITQESTCPVLLLPEDYHFTGFHKILFICDTPPSPPLLQEHITGSAFLFNADIHYLQINFEDSTPEDSNTNFAAAMQNILPGVSAHYHTASYTQLLPQLNKHLSTYDIDLIYFICPSRYFWPNLVRQKLKHHYPLSRNVPFMIQHLD